jgi:hypothetical protein
MHFLVWNKGLESAMIARMLVHIVMFTAVISERISRFCRLLLLTRSAAQLIQAKELFNETSPPTPATLRTSIASTILIRTQSAPSNNMLVRKPVMTFSEPTATRHTSKIWSHFCLGRQRSCPSRRCGLKAPDNSFKPKPLRGST